MEPGFKFRGDQRITVAGALALLLAAEAVFAPIAEANMWAERRQAMSARHVDSPPVPLPPLPRLPADFGSVPSSLGSVKPANHVQADRTVLLVQDVHLHREGQRAISRIVSDFSSQADLIAIEAASGPLNLSSYINYPCQPAVMAGANFLLEKNRISGVVHGAVAGGIHIPIVGVDDTAGYRANVQAIRDGAFRRDDARARVESRKTALAAERNRVYPPGLRAFDQAVAAYHEERATLPRHVAFLHSLKPSPLFAQFLKTAEVEASLDFSAVERERRTLAHDLARELPDADMRAITDSLLSHRLGNTTALQLHRDLLTWAGKAGVDLSRLPAFTAYVQYLALVDKIDPDRLLAAVTEAEIAGYERLAVSPEEKALVAESEATRLAGDLVSHTLTPETWARFQKVRSALAPSLAAVTPTFEHFYTAAHFRDGAMADNLIRALDERKASKAILVVGGFHKDAIARRLAERHIRTLVFTPTINDLSDNGSAYVSAFIGERTPLERLFRPRRLTAAPIPLPNAVRTEWGALVRGVETRHNHPRPGPGEVTDSGATATASGATVPLDVNGRTALLTVATDGDAITDDSLVEETPGTHSLLANLFHGRWAPLNHVMRAIFVLQIVPHELGHLIAGPDAGRRREYGSVGRLALGLFHGMPWTTAGGRAGAGILANLLFIAFLPQVLPAASALLPWLKTSIDVILWMTWGFIAGEVGLGFFSEALGIRVVPDVKNMRRHRHVNAHRRHRQVPDISTLPANFQTDAIRALKDILPARPMVGSIHFWRDIPNAGAGARYQRETPFFTWNTDGEIFIKDQLFLTAAARARSGELVVPNGESPVYRALMIAFLQAGFEFQSWNNRSAVSEPSHFDAAAAEASARFSPGSIEPSLDLVVKYEQEFESPETMAVKKLRWASDHGHVRLSEEEKRQLVEPDWAYRFEIKVLMDQRGPNGEEIYRTFVAWRVHHSDARGINKGGFRITDTVSADEVGDLARDMSIKTAVVNLPLGGGKGGILAKAESLSISERARLTRGYVRELYRLKAIGPDIDVPAPDMSTDANTMAWFADEYIRLEEEAGRISNSDPQDPFPTLSPPDASAAPVATPFLDHYHALWQRDKVNGDALAVVTGKPVSKGGIIGREEATGLGVSYVTAAAVHHYMGGRDLKGVRISVQGYGNVGFWAVKYLHDAGAIIVAISDKNGAVFNPHGLDVDALARHYYTEKHFTFAGYSEPSTDFRVDMAPAAGISVLFVDADVIVPAAGGKQINGENVKNIHKNVRLFMEAANGPTLPSGEEVAKTTNPDLIFVPDVLVNAGGVTWSSFEYRRNIGDLPRDITIQRLSDMLKEALLSAADDLFTSAAVSNISLRDATYLLAVERLHVAQNNSGPARTLFQIAAAASGFLAWGYEQVSSHLLLVTSAIVLVGIAAGGLLTTEPAVILAVAGVGGLGSLRERMLGAVREFAAARAVTEWMEARVQGRNAVLPVGLLLDLFSASELDQAVRASDGRSRSISAPFNRAVFERELRAMIARSPVLRGADRRALYALLSTAYGLPDAERGRHPASFADRRLASVYADESLGREAAEAAMREAINEQRDGRGGRTVLITPPSLEDMARQLAAGVEGVQVVAGAVSTEGDLDLNEIETALTEMDVFNGMTSVRLVLATTRVPNLTNLNGQSRFRNALIVLLNAALARTALTFQRLESVVNVLATVGRNA